MAEAPGAQRVLAKAPPEELVVPPVMAGADDPATRSLQLCDCQATGSALDDERFPVNRHNLATIRAFRVF